MQYSPRQGLGNVISQIKSSIFLFGLCCLVRGLLQIIKYFVLLADFEFCLGNNSLSLLLFLKSCLLEGSETLTGLQIYASLNVWLDWTRSREHWMHDFPISFMRSEIVLFAWLNSDVNIQKMFLIENGNVQSVCPFKMQQCVRFGMHSYGTWTTYLF